MSSRIDFIKNHKIDPETLDWKRSGNGLYIYAEIGPYWVSYVDAEGYRLIKDSSVVKQAVDLRKYSHG